MWVGSEWILMFRVPHRFQSKTVSTTRFIELQDVESVFDWKRWGTWIRVDFNVPSAPPLPIEDGFYILKFNESGRLKTSSPDLIESRRDEFFYYSNEGKYRLHQGGPLEQRL